MYTYQPELYHTTYEYESKPLYPQNYILDKTKETLYQTGMDRKSNSPPIILCETGGSRNAKAHKHRYLFYPSASRLSPFSDNYNINTYDKNSINYKDDNKNEKSQEKYQAMYDKSFELVKKISELVPEKEAKIKGNSDYYLNKDKDYMNIIDNQINTLTNHFQKSNFDLGYKTDGMLLQNSNINNSNDINNNTYGIYKNNILERINNSKNNTNNQKAFDINSKNRNYIDDYKKNLEYKINKGNNDIDEDENEKREIIEINEKKIQYKANVKDNKPNAYNNVIDNNIINEKSNIESEDNNAIINNRNENGNENQNKELIENNEKNDENNKNINEKDENKEKETDLNFNKKN